MTFNIARLKKIKVAGPSMPSFSPFFNDMVFQLLKDKYQLPDIHTINLTNEMDKEPELIYQNFLIPKLGKFFKFNLIISAVYIGLICNHDAGHDEEHAH